MNWQEVCEDPNLQNLPYKIELNERGKIEMSPAKNSYGMLQAEIAHFLKTLLHNGKVITECAVKTPKGTRVADVVWCSPKIWDIIKDEFDSSVSPEICIEVVSNSNTALEMEEKRNLYFGQGAKECWICDKNGNIEIYNSNGNIEKSEIVPDFPMAIEIG